MMVSKHAEKRMKERNGLSKKACHRIAQKAYDDGIPHSRTKGNLNKWVTSIFFRNTDANNIKLYGDKAYIFCGSTLITVIQIPANLANDLKSLVREDISRKEGLDGETECIVCGE